MSRAKTRTPKGTTPKLPPLRRGWVQFEDRRDNQTKVELGADRGLDDMWIGEALHVEQMASNHLWLAAYGSDGTVVHVNIRWGRSGKRTVTTWTEKDKDP